eukprot:jgi/Mesen1/7763/ME000408S06878
MAVLGEGGLSRDHGCRLLAEARGDVGAAIDLFYRRRSSSRSGGGSDSPLQNNGDGAPAVQGSAAAAGRREAADDVAGEGSRSARGAGDRPTGGAGESSSCASAQKAAAVISAADASERAKSSEGGWREEEPPAGGAGGGGATSKELAAATKKKSPTAVPEVVTSISPTKGARLLGRAAGASNRLGPVTSAAGGGSRGGSAGGSAGGAEPLGSVTLSVGKYRPISHACWQAGEAAPYLHLARAFEVVERESGRLKITDILCNDMSMGGSTVAAAICETTGVQRRRLHELYTSLGDLGPFAGVAEREKLDTPLGSLDGLKAKLQAAGSAATEAYNFLPNLLVAVDRTDGNRLLAFQHLSTRDRGGKEKGTAVELGDIKVDVCVFAFDFLYVNGQALVKEPLAERRRRMREAFPGVRPGFFEFAHEITAGVGLVHPSRGISMRFPRMIQPRPDKKPEDANSGRDIAELFHKQTRKVDITAGRGGASARTKAQGDVSADAEAEAEVEAEAEADKEGDKEVEVDGEEVAAEEGVIVGKLHPPAGGRGLDAEHGHEAEGGDEEEGDDDSENER